MKYYAQYNHATGELSKANVKCLNAEVDNIEISKEWFDDFEKCSYQDGQVVYNPDWTYIPTYEEVRQIREALYRDQKDPITCQIQSLRDEEETEEILAEIEALKVKRAEIVAKIKEENPYPEENE